MSATRTTKCPDCDGVTSRCLDSSLDADRTEYDGRRCRECVAREKRGGKPHGINCGSGNQMFPGRKRQAVQTVRYSGQHY